MINIKGWKKRVFIVPVSIFCLTTAVWGAELSLNATEQAVLSASFPAKKSSACIKNKGKKNVFGASACTLNLVTGSGTEGAIQIQNNSNVIARDIQAYLPWVDVTQDASECQTLLPNSTCYIYITPGSVAHPSTAVTIQGSNTTAAAVNIAINTLAVGDPWQGGRVYKITGNDVYVTAINDAAVPLPWDSSTPPYVYINGSDSYNYGAVNTLNIVEQLTVDPNTYAAGVCAVYQVGDSVGWYLPAVNELIDLFDAADTIPANFNLTLNNVYWASTQYDDDDAFSMEYQAPSTPLLTNKGLSYYVRCVKLGD